MLTIILNTLAVFGVIAILAQFKTLLWRLDQSNNGSYTVPDLMQDPKVQSILNEVLAIKTEHDHLKTKEFFEQILINLKSYNQEQRQVKKAWEEDKKGWYETRSRYKALQKWFGRNSG